MLVFRRTWGHARVPPGTKLLFAPAPWVPKLSPSIFNHCRLFAFTLHVHTLFFNSRESCFLTFTNCELYFFLFACPLNGKVYGHIWTALTSYPSSAGRRPCADVSFQACRCGDSSAAQGCFVIWRLFASKRSCLVALQAQKKALAVALI